MSFAQAAQVVSDADPARVWAVLLDGRGWSRWNHGVQWAVFEGEPAPGTIVTVKPNRAPQTALRIEAVEPERMLALVLTVGPLATLRMRWELNPGADGTVLVQAVATSGPLADPLLRRAAERIAGGMAANLQRLVALA